MKNTKNILLTLFLLLLCGFLGYNLWKNSRNPSTEGTLSLSGEGYSRMGADDDFSNTAKDTLFGYKGCERAGMYSFPNGDRQFVYQKYNILITHQPDTLKGEKITVVTKENNNNWEVPLPVDAYFSGFYREHMILNVGSDPEKREILFIDVKDRRPSFQTVLVDTPSVIAGKMWLHTPIEESEMKKVPECPEKSEWEQKGKKTAYAQLVLYDFSNGSVTRKSEYKCYGK